MCKNSCLSLLFIALAVFPIKSQDKIAEILKSELTRNFDVLKSKEIPVVYISLWLEEEVSQTANASYGVISNYNDNAQANERQLSITMRVGTYETNNLHFNGNLNNSTTVSLPNEDSAEAIKLTLWRAIQDAYTRAKDQLKSTHTRLTTKAKEDDTSPDFSVEKPTKYYEKPIKFNQQGVNFDNIKLKIKSLSKILGDNRDIISSGVYGQVSLKRQYLIDTEGTEIAQNSFSINLGASGVVMADDGTYLQNYKSYFSRVISDLPTENEMFNDIKNLSNILSQLKKAPKIDSYTGPVLLSSEVSGVFFHEFLGHRVEGARMKSGYDAQTLKKKIGQEILPTRLSVIFDPQISKYKNMVLSGDYKYDDEGVKGQRVEVIKNGILKNFLMSRVPIEGFSNSNGHGRGNLNIGTETRQSNMIIETSKPLSNQELKKLFLQQIKDKNLEYGYRIDKVSGGLTMTSAASANAFYLNPLIVYKVYADGRADELVRGVNIVGTPLAAFSQIIAEGDDMKTFNGTCGALSGGVPVSAVAPSMLVKELEFQKTGDNQKMEPFILERP